MDLAGNRKDAPQEPGGRSTGESAKTWGSRVGRAAAASKRANAGAEFPTSSVERPAAASVSAAGAVSDARNYFLSKVP